MKENVNAPLVKLIDSTLKESNKRIDSVDKFAEDVLENYAEFLKKKSVGFDILNSETREELLLAIHEIIKKKIYGFYDLNEYKEFLTKRNA